MTGFRIAAAALLSLACAPSLAAEPQARQIVLYSYAYSPSPIHLAAGERVTLTFVNRAGKGHDFTAPAFFAASRILDGSAPNGEVELRPGETRSLTLIPRAGRYEAHCSHFFHKQLGMRTAILVD